jgi:hypothetical protein
MKVFVDRTVNVYWTPDTSFIKNKTMEEITDAAVFLINKFAKRGPTTYIEEVGQQDVMVFCAQKYEPVFLKSFAPKGGRWMFSYSTVRLQGGSMAVGDFGHPSVGGGAQYRPRISNIDDSGIADEMQMFQDVFDFMEKSLKLNMPELKEAIAVAKKGSH